MYWNYRICELESGGLAIRAIIYDDSEQPTHIYPKGLAVHGDDRDELIEDLERQTRASFNSILTTDETEELEQLSRTPARLGVEWKD